MRSAKEKALFGLNLCAIPDHFTRNKPGEWMASGRLALFQDEDPGHR